MIGRIATREEEEDYNRPESSGKDPAAVSTGKRSGKARAEKMTPERRAEIAKKGRKSGGGDEDYIPPIVASPAIFHRKQARFTKARVARIEQIHKTIRVFTDAH